MFGSKSFTLALLSIVMAAPVAVNTPFGLRVIGADSDQLNGLAVTADSDGRLSVKRLSDGESVQQLGTLGADASVLSVDNKVISTNGEQLILKSGSDSEFVLNAGGILTQGDELVASVCAVNEQGAELVWGAKDIEGCNSVMLEATNLDGSSLANDETALKVKQNCCLLRWLCHGACCPCGGCPTQKTCVCPPEPDCAPAPAPHHCDHSCEPECPKISLCDLCQCLPCVCPTDFVCKNKGCLCGFKDICHVCKRPEPHCACPPPCPPSAEDDQAEFDNQIERRCLGCHSAPCCCDAPPPPPCEPKPDCCDSCNTSPCCCIKDKICDACNSLKCICPTKKLCNVCNTASCCCPPSEPCHVCGKTECCCPPPPPPCEVCGKSSCCC